MRGNHTHPLAKLFRTWYPKIDFTDLGRRTYQFHVVAAFFEGINRIMMMMAGFLLKKTMDIPDRTVTLYFSMAMTIFILSSIGASFIKQSNHRKIILMTGILGRLSFVGLFAFHPPGFVIFLVVWGNLMQAIFLPAQNMIFRSNYLRENRGVTYARAKTIMYVTAAAAGALAGEALEWKEYLFPAVFALIGVSGFVMYLLYFLMPRNHEREAAVTAVENQRRNFFGDFFEILKKDRLFLRYELYFFLYGCGFMMVQPLMPIFLNNELGANWKEASSVLTVIHPIMIILFLPLFGRLLDRTNAIPVASLAFLLLSLWPLVLSFTTTITLAYVSAAFFGIAMSGVDVAWNLGSLTFAKKENIQGYTAVHVTFVGLRAATIPHLGLLLQERYSWRFLFLVASATLITASILMFTLYKKARTLSDGEYIDKVGSTPETSQ